MNSIAQELRDTIGDDAMALLCERFGGERIYIPKRVPVPNREQRIKSEFVSHVQEGSTCMAAYEQIAHHYRLSTRRVQMLVAS